MKLIPVLQTLKRKNVGLDNGYFIGVSLDEVSVCLCTEDTLGHYYAEQYEHCSYYIKGFFVIRENVQFYIEQNEVPQKIENDYIGDLPREPYEYAKKTAEEILAFKNTIKNSLVRKEYQIGEFDKKPWEWSHHSYQHIYLDREPIQLGLAIDGADLTIANIYLHFESKKRVHFPLEKELASELERQIIAENPAFKMRYLLKEKKE